MRRCGPDFPPNHRPAFVGRPGGLACTFPVDQGFRSRDGFAIRLPAPPSSLLLRRLPSRAPAQPEKSLRFRGVFGCGPFRKRTGDCVFRVWKTPRSLFVSVGKLGGSDSSPIRLGKSPRAVVYSGSRDPRASSCATAGCWGSRRDDRQHCLLRPHPSASIG